MHTRLNITRLGRASAGDLMDFAAKAGATRIYQQLARDCLQSLQQVE
ncbi:hypothetical protein [Paraburkholderia phenazinium]|jgi:hypothetical protein|uniref:Uncharacterized protein n=1 Tax=Paraburkholderia phenazinium TaxID=60549 RepID=A0A1G8KCX9_9BURK|nr:hypothetical protein [Paraburkholderia phenazinium]SDI41282.1 hypothetical protein SAMN05216466_12283 [Paraburkholderia phenazinium]